MSSGVNMLTKCVKISDKNKTETFELISFQRDQKYDQKSAVQIQAVFRNF